MKKKILWRLILIGVAVLLSLIFFLPNIPIFKSMPEWWKKTMPSRGIVLGLDLQGGTHLVFEVQAERAVEITVERVSQSIRELMKKKKLQADVKTQAGVITVSPSSIEIRTAIEKNYPTLKLEETSSGLTCRLSNEEASRIKENASDQAVETIRNRIDQFGVAEPTIHRQAENEIVIQLPGVKDPKRAIDIIGKTALLEFKVVDDESPVSAELPSVIAFDDESELLEKFSGRIPEGRELLFERTIDLQTGEAKKLPFLIKKETLLTGDLLTEAKVSLNRFNEPYVAIAFNPTGAKIFEEVTGANVKKRLAIILDGNVYSAPKIKERIAGGDASIEGGFSIDEAKDLSIVLKAGALPAPVKMLQNITVGPSLGRDSIQAGKLAGIIGAIAVIAFMVFYYRLSGLIADLALFLNILLLLGAMAYLEATLTLPGIAGVILAVGMAVDSNVLMFERMREELRAGKTPRAAVDSGYQKAFWTIFDSHVTTLITSAVLFQFGTGPIKGFAVTLSLGVSINLFTALVGTKTIFDILNQRKEVKRLSI
ncbi:MAG: protein translocase subunit SecD [Nitrospirae bacterium]|nr:protein translocase subunit SecD [Nitrospirota bacterium]